MCARDIIGPVTLRQAFSGTAKASGRVVYDTGEYFLTRRP